MKRLFWMLISLLLVTACKKEKGAKPTTAVRIKTVTNGSVITYTYDAQQRLVKAEADQGFYKEEYVYESDKITWILTEPSQSYKAFYTINARGLLKTKQVENDNEIIDYEFNDKGYPLRSYNNAAKVSETNYYYNSTTGLLDSMRSTDGIDWSSTSVFLFYTDKVNTVSEENFGRGFWGNFAPHPVKSIAIRRPNGDAVTVSVTNYTYTYDAQERIISRSFSTSGGQSGTESYTYY